MAYVAGLRVSEAVGLKVTDVDGQRMTLRVEQGKGPQSRYAMLSPVLLQRLALVVAHRSCTGPDPFWRMAVPRSGPDGSVEHQQLNRAVHAAAEAAGIDKRVSPYTLVEIRVIQVLGHKKLDNLPRRTMSRTYSAP